MPNKKCFVIMPFGEKPDVGGRPLDFDKVYKYLIKPPIVAMGIECVRCDEIGKPGLIHSEMIGHIYEDDIAVVDITTLNPNVFYELGIRHALRASVTVLIRKKDTKLPFNIQGLKAIEYDPEDLESVEETKKKIQEFVRNGLQALKGDSLVHEVLRLRIGTLPRVIDETMHISYSLIDNPEKSIYITTGGFQKIKGIDIWVSSENTNMQMARFYDFSVSSIIRYLGAEKNHAGLVVNDCIADALRQIVGDQHAVPPATVIETTAGQLSKSHAVKMIFHVASVVGGIGRGYVPIQNISDCVTNALAKADSTDLCPSCTSILFPLMGAGTARGDLREIVASLINAAIEYLRANRNSRVNRVHFAAFTEDELAACLNVLDSSHVVKCSRSGEGR
jgi:O-acetyl-ADP-ribose deacetylase (regulator of RNase III)